MLIAECAYHRGSHPDRIREPRLSIAKTDTRGNVCACAHSLCIDGRLLACLLAGMTLCILRHIEVIEVPTAACVSFSMACQQLCRTALLAGELDSEIVLLTRFSLITSLPVLIRMHVQTHRQSSVTSDDKSAVCANITNICNRATSRICTHSLYVYTYSFTT